MRAHWRKIEMRDAKIKDLVYTRREMMKSSEREFLG
jgi:hypothetical protein